VEQTRVDRWLWAVRLYKTRSAATAACRGGHVSVDGHPAKPAHSVRAGDRVEVRVDGWDRRVEVTKVIDKRVAAPLAAECLVELSPPRPPREEIPPPMFVRLSSTGRPTKRDRRQLDRLRGR
jgi:ribosome-associated heat shock protein Hsp15